MSADITAKLGTLPAISGWGDSDTITIEFNEDQFMQMVGQDGEVADIFNKNMSGTIDITVMATSQSHVQLLRTLNSDIVNLNGSVPFAAADDSFEFSTPGARIKKYPSPDRKNKEVGTYKYQLIFGHGKLVSRQARQDY